MSTRYHRASAQYTYIMAYTGSTTGTLLLYYKYTSRYICDILIVYRGKTTTTLCILHGHFGKEGLPFGQSTQQDWDVGISRERSFPSKFHFHFESG